MMPFYAPDSFWNAIIVAAALVSPNSAAIVRTSIVPFTSRASFANTDEWGISLVYARPDSKTYTIAHATYWDYGPISFKIPEGARPSTGDDHHLAVIDGDEELDFWNAHYDAAHDRWTAGARIINDINGWGAAAASGLRGGGAVASGFALMGGVVRPEEIAQGHIDHALSLMVPTIRKSHIAPPATTTNGFSSDPAAIPEGAHLQLDPCFNVEAQNWPHWEKTLAVALQIYGAFVSDRGGALGIYGQTDINAGNVSWASTGTPKGGSLANLPWDKMRIIEFDANSTRRPVNERQREGPSYVVSTLDPVRGDQNSAIQPITAALEHGCPKVKSKSITTK